MAEILRRTAPTRPWPGPEIRKHGWIDEIRPILLDELSSMGEVPLLPGVAREVMAMAADPEIPTAKLVGFINKDPVLAAQLLRVANSPFYGGKVTTLQQALMRVGTKGLAQLLLTVSAHRLLTIRDRPALTARLQTRSGAVAACASYIAQVQRNVDADAAYTAGLLHDVGWAVVHGLIARAGPKVPVMLRADDSKATAVAEAMHQSVGGVMARKWTLPPEVISAIEYHHEPESLGSGSAYELALTVGVATRVCDALRIGPADPLTTALEEDPMVVRLAMAPARLEAVLRRMKEGYASMAAK